MLCICHNCQCFNVLHTHNLTLRLTSNAEEQRQCLGCCNEENTCADDHHDLLLDVLFLVVHGDVNAYGSDNCNDTCNGIAASVFMRCEEKNPFTFLLILSNILFTF